MPDGKVELARDDIRKIVPGFWPATEWEHPPPASDRGGLRGTVRGRLVGHRERADHRSGRRVAGAPSPRSEARCRSARMAAVLDRLERPCIDPDFDRFQKALGIETKVARGPHVILLHQHSDAEADERIALLERVITGYHLLFAAQGVELSGPAPPAGLGLVRRSRKTTWLSCDAEDADAFATTRGYFHPTWNAVVAFDARSSDRAANGSQQAGGAARRAASGTASWSIGRRRGAGSGSSSPTSRRGRSAVPRRRHFLIGSTVKSRVRRCFWIWIGGRSTWARRPTR